MRNGLKHLSWLLITLASSGHAAVIYQANDGSNIDLYGRLGFNVSDKKTGDVSGDFDGRIGFSARQMIDDKFAVIGFTQYQVNAAEYANNIKAEDPDDLTARYVWAGVDFAEYGKMVMYLPRQTLLWPARQILSIPPLFRFSARMAPYSTRIR